MSDNEGLRVEAVCLFCPAVFSESGVGEEHLDQVRAKVRKDAGRHLMEEHPDKVWEMMQVFVTGFVPFVKSGVDLTRRLGQIFCGPLQRGAQELVRPPAAREE